MFWKVFTQLRKSILIQVAVKETCCDKYLFVGSTTGEIRWFQYILWLQQLEQHKDVLMVAARPLSILLMASFQSKLPML
jgi:hypothetical protein